MGRVTTAGHLAGLSDCLVCLIVPAVGVVREPGIVEPRHDIRIVCSGIFHQRLVNFVAEYDLKVTEVRKERSGEMTGPFVQLGSNLPITRRELNEGAETGWRDQLLKLIGH